jgi:hypothetical protein
MGLDEHAAAIVFCPAGFWGIFTVGDDDCS